MPIPRSTLGCVVLLLPLLGTSCGDQGTGQTREAVAAGLLVAGGGGLSAEQIQTFPAQIQDPWAVVYDPVAPPGCVPGGLHGAPTGPPLPANPCRAWVLRREKAVWRLAAQGPAGSFNLPDGTPNHLGDPMKLEFLTR